MMSLTEEKILNGIKYFVVHTQNVGRTKLFKLLYFWDFIHFKYYGLSITGYDYYTYPFGPVPKQLFDKIIKEDLPDYLRGNLYVTEDDNEEDDDEFRKFKIILKNQKVNYDCFSPNELQVLKDVACIYKEATARQMTEISHLKNSPWDKTIKRNGMYEIIDYYLAVDDETTLDYETIKERFELQKELLSDGRI